MITCLEYYTKNDSNIGLLNCSQEKTEWTIMAWTIMAAQAIIVKALFTLSLVSLGMYCYELLFNLFLSMTSISFSLRLSHSQLNCEPSCPKSTAIIVYWNVLPRDGFKRRSGSKFISWLPFSNVTKFSLNCQYWWSKSNSTDFPQIWSFLSYKE